MKRALATQSLWLFSCLIVVGFLVGCEDGAVVDTRSTVDAERAYMPEDGGPAAAQAEALTNGEVKTVASFDASAGELPEGIAIDAAGNIYVSMSGLGEIWKLDPDGEFVEVVAGFDLNPGDTGALGVRFDDRGNLYAAVSSTNPDVNGVWRVAPSGVKERLDGTSALVFPNDVTVSHRGVVYISDSGTGSIWRYFPGGSAEVWIQHEALEGTGAFGLGVPIGANGLATVSGNKLPIARQVRGASVGGVIVANSEKGQIVYVPIFPDGSAGEPAILIADGDLFGIDGIDLDARGAIYAAVNVANSIVRIDRDGSAFEVVASGAPLDFPASLAFGTGRDQHTLFIANFAIIHFLSDPPTPELANPGVLSLRVGPPGRTR